MNDYGLAAARRRREREAAEEVDRLFYEVLGRGAAALVKVAALVLGLVFAPVTTCVCLCVYGLVRWAAWLERQG